MRRDPFAPFLWAIACMLVVIGIVLLGHIIVLAVR